MLKFCMTMGSGSYRGWLDSFNLRWVVKFQDDNETAEVLFQDKDVRLYNSIFFIYLYNIRYAILQMNP